MYSRCHVGNPSRSCANAISALVMLCWCLVQHSSAFTQMTWRFCWPLHCMVSKSPHNRLCSAMTCWSFSSADNLRKFLRVRFFFSAYSHCHSSQTRTCCSHIQQSFNSICTFCGKEQEVSYRARRLSGKVGYDWIWRSNHEWSSPVMYLCFHRYRMVH